ncbi:MAG: cyclic dehypoxanthinyl futalosine synthase [Bacteroidales bacterium]|jgi:cyclic dehypoxanthinyl futalosine synthase|nr:cyclic dehypoxanthinyl futalosine synthase [Bacteroidales bacterium]
MKQNEILQKALNLESISIDEGLFLYESTPLEELMYIGNLLKKRQKAGNLVTWQIDRNVNITNACISQCKFCNFYRKPNDQEVYITSIDEYKTKIEELFQLGGDQLLLQGGLHPRLKLDFYTDLFKELKSAYPALKLHALGPPEIVHLARLEKKSYREVLEQLLEAGLDSLPGAGAEILCDRVRKSISPGKANTRQWLDVMREAHQLQMVTSATMMFGHVETKRERIEHLAAIRDVQSEKPEHAPGFLAFIPWPFQDENTLLQRQMGVQNRVTSEEYIRTIAISRIMLPNIKNIQASWLTVGKDIAQLCLHAGANDFGSIMIEENVVSSAGAEYTFDAAGIQAAIREAGFIPQLRNQKYEYIDYQKSKA